MTQKIYSQQQASQFACRRIDGRNLYSEMRMQNAVIVGLVEMNLPAPGNELARVKFIFTLSRRGKGATFAAFASSDRAAQGKSRGWQKNRGQKMYDFQWAAITWPMRS
jgi:hypothetical protein